MSEERKVQKNWPKSEVFALISNWKILPELWDTKSKSYRCRIQKQNAVKELARKFGTTTNEISRKLHNLRTQFHSELRKLKKKSSKKTDDDEAGDNYNQSTWEFFDLVKFISSDHINQSTNDNRVRVFPIKERLTVRKTTKFSNKFTCKNAFLPCNSNYMYIF